MKEKHIALTEEVNEIALIVIYEKRVQSISSIESWAYRTNKDLVFKKEEIKCNNTTKQYKNN